MNELELSAIEAIIQRTEHYLSQNNQPECYCDFMWMSLSSVGDIAIFNFWEAHKEAAFSTSPDYTGCDFHAIDIKKYGLTRFPDDKFKGEYGAARKRLVTCTLNYFKELYQGK